MADRPLFTSVGMDPSVAPLVADCVLQAVAALGLETDVAAVAICADDLSGDDDAWFRFIAGSPGALPSLEIYCHPESFGTARPATGTIHPPRAVWEQSTPPLLRQVTSREFSRARSDAFVHHQLLTVRDLLRGALAPARAPRSLAEGLASAWAVTADARLSRMSLPGYSLAERRGRFSRLFSTAGVLMPEHWHIFESLWAMDEPGTRDVIALVRKLPRL